MANVVSLESETLSTVTEESPWKVIWRRFRKHKLALGGIVTITLIALACFLAPWVAPYDPIRDLARDANGQILSNDPPSREHLMGTDSIGRDVFSRLLYAGRISLAVASDAELGERDLRLITPGGISNRVRFIIGALPILTFLTGILMIQKALEVFKGKLV